MLIIHVQYKKIQLKHHNLWQTTQNRETGPHSTRRLVGHLQQKIGFKHMCRLAAHELLPGSFWKNPETQRSLRMTRLYISSSLYNTYSYNKS